MAVLGAKLLFLGSVAVEKIYAGSVSAYVRMPGFSPSTITGLQLWLDASDAETLFDATSGGSLVAADGTVKRWEDKSGNNRHATEATNGPQRKLAVRGGLDALRFDGTNDRLNTGAISSLDILDMTVLVVAATTAAKSNPALTISYGDFTASHTNEDRHGLVIFSAGSTFPSLAGFVRNASGGAVLPATGDRPQFSLNELLVAGYYVDSLGGCYSFKNLATPVAGINGPADTPSLHQKVSLGVNDASSASVVEFFQGDICEVIIYSATLTAAQRNAVIGYLMAKWAIT
jgi:hypothetical protein